MPNDDTTLPEKSIERAREAGSLRTSLVLYFGERVEVIALQEGVPVVVGRAEPAEIAIDEPNLSRRHARFVRRGDTVEVEDLGSTNGTFLRGEPIEGVAPLQPGEAVSLGSVTISVNRTDDRAGLIRGIVGYEPFLERIQDELVRTRAFLRGVSVLMVRALDEQADDSHVSRWVPNVRTTLRPVDRMTMYGSRGVLVLLAEADRARALAIAQQIVGDGRLGVGIALDGASAEALIDTARKLARRADRANPVVVEGHDAHADLEPVFVSPAMSALDSLIDRVAQARIPVLVQGETGSGKEVVAHAIHARGPRAEGPLRAVNCGAMLATLLEALVFGHEKGAFTGAERTKPGLFEQAHNGTLFLDEVAELTAAAQVALLRVLESKTVTRVGGTESVDVDVRVVVATHRDLEAMVEQGTFRQDLWFRLNPMTLTIPPLRDRAEDIDPLIDRFLAEAAREAGTRVRGIEPDARERLHLYAWPGNVRELRNVIERAVVVALNETIGLADLPQKLRGGAPSPAVTDAAPQAPDADFKERVRAYETRLILDALSQAEGNQTRAAQILRMPLRTMVHKIKAYGIKKPGDAD